MEKTGIYTFLAEPFHCDFTGRLFMGHLGNHMLNAADFHSSDRGFGMKRLNSIHKTWVLSRLAIEMQQMPEQYTRFTVATWVESCMRYFTNRNFCVQAEDNTVLGYGRSVWAMIDTETRQPLDILAVDDGAMKQWIETGRECPINKGSRVRMTDQAQLVRQLSMSYSDIDINGHVNSVKYIEHVLDLWDMAWYERHDLHRFEVAYVAEAHQGDVLSFFMEESAPQVFSVRIQQPDGTEVARCMASFADKA